MANVWKNLANIWKKIWEIYGKNMANISKKYGKYMEIYGKYQKIYWKKEKIDGTYIGKYMENVWKIWELREASFQASRIIIRNMLDICWKCAGVSWQTYGLQS